jgi:hypothetical protein
VTLNVNINVAPTRKNFAQRGVVDDVIDYALRDDLPILALLLYGKNEQSDLSPAQRRAVAALAAEMKRR